jgi:hypothetical protein
MARQAKARRNHWSKLLAWQVRNARDKPPEKEAGDASRYTSNIAHFGKFASCLKARAFWFTPHPSVPVATAAVAWPSSYSLDKAR